MSKPIEIESNEKQILEDAGQERIDFWEKINAEFAALTYEQQVNYFLESGFRRAEALELVDRARKKQLNVAVFCYAATVADIKFVTALYIMEKVKYIQSPVSVRREALYAQSSYNVLCNRMNEIFGMMFPNSIRMSLGDLNILKEPKSLLPDSWQKSAASAS